MMTTFDEFDTILIRDLDCSCIIGIFEEERKRRQTVRINAEVFTDLSKAGASDDFNDALNYSEVEEYLKKTAENTEFFLLEKLAAHIAEGVLKFDAVKAVRLTLDKFEAAAYASSIAVRIFRKKGE